MKKSVGKIKVHDKPVFGNKAVILNSSDETNGSASLIEIELAINGCDTKQIHGNYYKTFRVLKGELTVNANGRNSVLKEGESCSMSRGVVHYFRNNSSRVVKFTIEFRPGQPAFEKTLMISYGLAKDGLTYRKGIPKRLSHMALLINLSGKRIPGIWKVLQPLFTGLAQRAIRKGELNRLIARYC